MATAPLPDESPNTGSPVRFPLLRPLGVRDFRLVWLGEFVSLLGDQFYFVALAWLTIQLTGSGLALGTLLMVGAVPRALFMLAGGAITDRFSPRSLMLWSNLLRAVLVAAIASLVLAGTVALWELYALAIVFGAVDAVFYPAVSTVAPALLDEARLPAGNMLMQGSMQLSVLIGPGLAGALIASLGRQVGNGSAFGLDSASFIIAGLMLWLVRSAMRPARQAAGENASESNLLGSVADGLRYAWSDPVTRSLLLIIAAIDFAFAGPFNVGLASLAHTRFTGGAAAFGLMLSGWGIGSLLGTVVGGAIAVQRRRGLLSILLVAYMGLGLGSIALAPNAGLAALLTSCIGFGSGFVNVTMLPWIQMRTAPSMLGRIMSLFMFASVGLGPLSFALAGVLSEINATLLFAAAGGIVVGAAATAAMGPIRAID